MDTVQKVTASAEAAAVVFVLKGYPRLSETFIAQEILALERRGLPIHIVSLRHPTDRARHPVHAEITAPVTYLPEYLHHEPLRVLRAWAGLRRRPRYRLARAAWLRDLVRDRTRNRVRRFGQALVLAAELPPGVQRLHAHFLHTPASVARYAAQLTGLEWSVSAHAKDIWTTPEWEKREKLASCRWLVTCTAANHRHLAGLTRRKGTVELVYHGLDFCRFPPPPSRRSVPGPVTLLSVGRAVEKKGYDDLLSALSMLEESLSWRLIHVGGGPLLSSLQAQAGNLGLASRIQWLGPQPQQEVLRAYRRAQLFVLPCRVGSDGDRDGLPNVLLEAQSQGLACVSTRISGIPELIEHGETGLLVGQREPAALASALATLIADGGLRRRLGEAGLARVRARFSHQTGIDQLWRRFAVRQARAEQP
jgi:glycosyltransferase involved in cell wall biosynthesis